jgi:hypothetical protein
VSYKIDLTFSAIIVSVLSWGLAELFVLKRKMALPAILLLITFIGGVLISINGILGTPSVSNNLLAASVVSIAAWFHWKRFRVPITVASGIAAFVIFVVSFYEEIFQGHHYAMHLFFIGGVVMFYTAMCWDVRDLQRVTGKSDVAFWLHLTASLFIVHPVFVSFGVLEGNTSLVGLAAVIVLYIVLTLISVVIDRRAFMVSALMYVLVALTKLLQAYGFSNDSFDNNSIAYVGVFIGFLLLLLSVFWHKARRNIVVYLPRKIRNILPLVV